MLGSCNDSPWSDFVPDVYSCTSGYPLLPRRRRAGCAFSRIIAHYNHHCVSDPLIQMLRRWILDIIYLFLRLTVLSIFNFDSLEKRVAKEKSILSKLIYRLCKFLFRTSRVHCPDIVNRLLYLSCTEAVIKKRKEDDEISGDYYCFSRR